MIKQFVTIVVVVIALFVPAESSEGAPVAQQKYPPSLADALETVQSSVVQISFHARGGDEVRHQTGGAPFVDFPLGTGFVVSAQGYVITARHVIDAGRTAMANF